MFSSCQLEKWGWSHFWRHWVVVGQRDCQCGNYSNLTSRAWKFLGKKRSRRASHRLDNRGQTNYFRREQWEQAMSHYVFWQMRLSLICRHRRSGCSLTSTYFSESKVQIFHNSLQNFRMSGWMVNALRTRSTLQWASIPPRQFTMGINALKKFCNNQPRFV